MRFFVRLKGTAAGAELARAELKITSPAGSATIQSDQGQVIVTHDIDRTGLAGMFLFRIPWPYTFDKVTFLAKVIPANGRTDPDPTNNEWEHAMPFENIPVPAWDIFRLTNLDKDCTALVAPATDAVSKFRQYARLLMPLAEMATIDRGEYEVAGCGSLYGSRGSIKANAALSRLVTLENPKGLRAGDRYLGLVSGNPTYHRGAAAAWGISQTASAAEGSAGTFANDSGSFFVGSRGYDMAGWVGVHELGHTYGLYHAEGGCGETNPTAIPFPYPSVNISPATSGDAAIYGFNIDTLNAIPPTAPDIMSYCNRAGQWISRTSYHRLMDSIKNRWTALPPGDRAWPAGGGKENAATRNAAGPHVLISGFVDLTDPSASTLDPVVTMEAEPPANAGTSQFSVVLRDATKELARHPLKVGQVHPGPAPKGFPEQPDTRVFAQWVPAVAGLRQIVIEGPNGQALITKSAGSAAPLVRITSPNGGETLTGNTINVAWTASDGDAGDTLTFILQYSADGGLTWSTVGDNLTGTTRAVRRSLLKGGTQSLFRLGATDGINSSGDTSDAPFTIANQSPVVRITTPAAGARTAIGLSYALAASVTDLDGTAIARDKIVWRSDIDGELGKGQNVVVTFKTPARHRITVTATDEANASTSATAELDVISDYTQLPAAANALTSLTTSVQFRANQPLQTIDIAVGNAGTTALNWTASASAPWVRLTPGSGTTPGRISASLGDISALPEGVSRANITISSPGLTALTVAVELVKEAAAPRPAVSQGGVINAAQFGAQAGVAPGTWIEIYGSELSTTTREWSGNDFKGSTAPTSLDGVGVTVAEKPAFIRFISPGQINAQVPDGIGTGPVPVVVTNSKGSSVPINVTATAVLPGLLAPFSVNNRRYVAAFQGSTVVGSPQFSAVKPGDVVTLYGIGFGAVAPNIPAGGIAAELNGLSRPFSVRIGQNEAAASYKGLGPGFVGLYQFNITVPNVADGDHAVTIDLGGAGTGQEIYLWVKR